MPARNDIKRILMILENESFPDDTRVYLEALALVEAGFAVTVICPTGKRKAKSELVEGVRVYRYPQPWELGGLIGYLYEYAYSLCMASAIACFVLVRHGFDAVHVHCPPDLNALLAIFFQMLGKQFVVDLHDLSPELYQARKNNAGSQTLIRMLRWFERLACRRADALIATNQSQQRVQIERGRANPRRCFIVRNGPNEIFVPTAKPLPELVSPKRSTIGYVGVIGIQDGVDYLIRALKVIREVRGDFQAVIVGAGPALESVKRLVTELGLAEHVRFTGFVDFRDVPRYIASFDVCVTPDPSNAYNDSCTTIKTMEYMAIGRPTVAFATRENQLTAGEAALYARDNDIPAFATEIMRLMDDPELRARLGAIGRRRIDEGLSWENQRTLLVTLYDDLFAGKLTKSALRLAAEKAEQGDAEAARPRTLIGG